MISLQSVVYLPLLIIGASAIIIDPSRQRNTLTAADRRQVADITTLTNSNNDIRIGSLYRDDPPFGFPSICGATYNCSDIVATAAESVVNSFGLGSTDSAYPICDHPVTVTFQGQSITLQIAGSCNDCQPNDLRLTSAAFDQLDESGASILHNATWSFD